MKLDATVTVGDLLTMGAALLALVSILVWYVGSKHFPDKAEMAALKEHVDGQVAVTRQDVNSAVGRMEVLITSQVKLLSEQGQERHTKLCEDMRRLEHTIGGAVEDGREARDTARDARWQADLAKQMAEQLQKTLEAGITRMEQLVQALLNRDRRGDETPR